MEAQAVEQLSLIRRQYGGQSGYLHGLRIAGIGGHAGHRLRHSHTLQRTRHFFQGGGGAEAIQPQGIHRLHNGLAVAQCQRLNQRPHMAAVHRAQHLAHGCFLQLAAAKSYCLIGEAERVAHGTSS